jgi:benzoyl-CoA reductase/2-hydroxyglutaryl-CoA dehydratase subunit BcrC/BadD/HgdB
VEHVEQLERAVERAREPPYADVLGLIESDPKPITASDVFSDEEVAVLERLRDFFDQSFNLDAHQLLQTMA